MCRIYIYNIDDHIQIKGWLCEINCLKHESGLCILVHRDYCYLQKIILNDTEKS